jgi:DNA-binding transcriptional regulator YdaS (Cro superfamily)
MDKLSDAAIRFLGGDKSAADFFGVTLGAVSQWRYNGLPPARELELIKRKPDVYFAAQSETNNLGS